MKFGVVIFPGSNCDSDTIHVLRNVFKQEVEPLWHKERGLKGCDFILLPGGFAHGDYLRAGAVARFSPIMEDIINFANQGGNVLGICNGFQVLCEAQLLPGALIKNLNQQFICNNLFIRAATNNSPLTQDIDTDEVLKMPVAHGEGRYFAQQETINKLKSEDQILFNYCDEQGYFSEAANPNGSVEAIAGICNEGRNVFGLMPHPERAAEDVLGSTDGAKILSGIIQPALEA